MTKMLLAPTSAAAVLLLVAVVNIAENPLQILRDLIDLGAGLNFETVSVVVVLAGLVLAINHARQRMRHADIDKARQADAGTIAYLERQLEQEQHDQTAVVKLLEAQISNAQYTTRQAEGRANYWRKRYDQVVGAYMQLSGGNRPLLDDSQAIPITELIAGEPEETGPVDVDDDFPAPEDT